MFQPLSLFVGLRYVRARTRKFFVSFITWASLAGIYGAAHAAPAPVSAATAAQNQPPRANCLGMPDDSHCADSDGLAHDGERQQRRAHGGRHPVRLIHRAELRVEQ